MSMPTSVGAAFSAAATQWDSIQATRRELNEGGRERYIARGGDPAKADGLLALNDKVATLVRQCELQNPAALESVATKAGELKNTSLIVLAVLVKRTNSDSVGAKRALLAIAKTSVAARAAVGEALRLYKVKK